VVVVIAVVVVVVVGAVVPMGAAAAAASAVVVVVVVVVVEVVVVVVVEEDDEEEEEGDEETISCQREMGVFIEMKVNDNRKVIMSTQTPFSFFFLYLEVSFGTPLKYSCKKRPTVIPSSTPSYFRSPSTNLSGRISSIEETTWTPNTSLTRYHVRAGMTHPSLTARCSVLNFDNGQERIVFVFLPCSSASGNLPRYSRPVVALRGGIAIFMISLT
jgi:hypothetical protein